MYCWEQKNSANAKGHTKRKRNKLVFKAYTLFYKVKKIENNYENSESLGKEWPINC